MEGWFADWIALYKLGRLAVLAGALLGIAVWLWRRPQLEQVALRMLEDDPS
jgi:hypothetical protein